VPWGGGVAGNILTRLRGETKDVRNKERKRFPKRKRIGRTKGLTQGLERGKRQINTERRREVKRLVPVDCG